MQIVIILYISRPATGDTLQPNMYPVCDSSIQAACRMSSCAAVLLLSCTLFATFVYLLSSSLWIPRNNTCTQRLFSLLFEFLIYYSFLEDCQVHKINIVRQEKQ